MNDVLGMIAHFYVDLAKASVARFVRRVIADDVAVVDVCENTRVDVLRLLRFFEKRCEAAR